jgi:pSer/pThr/pTyr-binding forkhead associated (FHA) protein
MAQATKQYKRTMGGSIGAGIGSVFGGSGKTYFILEHKTESQYHRAGESQEIIVDQVELGRDSKCQVRYDDSFGTVSRRHAAIYRSGDRWKLIPLSETNSTLVNGRRITQETMLQNGDEIQLSNDGPKLGFIVPTGKQAYVGSIGLTRRLSLFRQQALVPYKRAITALSILLVLAIAGGVWYGTKTTQQLEMTQAQLNETRTSLADQIIKNAGNVAIVDSLSKQLLALNQKDAALSGQVSALTKKLTAQAQEKNEPEISKDQQKPQSQGSTSEPGDIKFCNPYVFAVYVDKLIAQAPGRDPVLLESSRCIGTGYMLEDGRFVTARHVVEPWVYYEYFHSEAKEKYGFFNWCLSNGGEIVADYVIVSPAGKRYSFSYNQLISNKGNDVGRVIQNDPILLPGLYKTSNLDRYDWAYFQTGATEGLKFDNELSRTLAQGTALEILGFPAALGTNDIYNVSPIYSNCVASSAGLMNGVIISSNDNTVEGSSGGPVFARKGGQIVVVGHVSGGIITSQKGIIVPISEVK